MIARLRSFAAFWYDFVIGDDWRVAVGVVFALGATYGVAQWSSAGAWWVVPVVVVVLLSLSLRRAVRGRRQ